MSTHNPKFSITHKAPRRNIADNCPHFVVSRFLTPVRCDVLCDGEYFVIVGTHTTASQNDKVTILILNLQRECVFSQSTDLRYARNIEQHYNNTINSFLSIKEGKVTQPSFFKNLLNTIG